MSLEFESALSVFDQVEFWFSKSIQRLYMTTIDCIVFVCLFSTYNLGTVNAKNNQRVINQSRSCKRSEILVFQSQNI